MLEDYKLKELTSQFLTFSLDEDVLPFDRKDKKYLFLIEDLHKILSALKPHYHILAVNGQNHSHYQTIYYDTESYDFYTAHHNGKLNRYKVRVRNYIETGRSYLEVKFKSNKRRTIKERIETDDQYHFSREDYEFLSSAIPFDPYKLSPSMMTKYVRFTLLNFEHLEKVTIDIYLEFNHLKNKDEIKVPDIGIIEVKHEGGKSTPLLTNILNNGIVRNQRVSKYCLGMSLLDAKVKKNRYKPKLLFIDQMQKRRNHATDLT